MPTFAFFISDHGFGHAARALALMDAITEIEPHSHFIVVSMCPPWFLARHPKHWSYDLIRQSTDIGVVQKDALTDDLEATLTQLNSFYPFSDAQIQPMLQALQPHRPDAILCDIAPMGLTVAKQMGLPSILIQNFTWPFIYSNYDMLRTQAVEIITYLTQLNQDVDLHIQAQPCSQLKASLPTVGPISRKVKPAAGWPLSEGSKPRILVTMGAFTSTLAHSNFSHLPEFEFLTVGNHSNSSMTCIDPESIYFPNLVHQVDAVIGKAGYSTSCEAFHAGVPFGFLSRPAFAESVKLEKFLEHSGIGMVFSAQVETWTLDSLQGLLARRKRILPQGNGADQAAKIILEFME